MKPYWSDESIALYHGDWRDHLQEITALEADLIVTDPPYGETRLPWDRWPDGWPSIAAGLAPAMWCWGSMRMLLDRRDDFAAWTFSQDVIWEKHNGMPESVTDRLSTKHEHLFLLTKSRRYWFDLDPVREQVTTVRPDALSWSRDEQGVPGQKPQHRPGRAARLHPAPRTDDGSNQ